MIKIVNNIKEANCITHSGTMHADEVFATAFLELYLEDIKVCRTNSINPKEVSESTLIYDIGRGKFDHHQLDSEKRENGIPYCAFGLLWKEFGCKYLKKINIELVEEVFAGVDLDLVEGIDADDNGIFPKIESKCKVKTLSNIIKIFNPSYASNQDSNEQFIKAVEVAKRILLEEIQYINGKVTADKKVKKILENQEPNQKYLILDEFLPYEETILTAENKEKILFVAFPSNRGGYAIKTISKSLEDKSARMEFPNEWAGLSGKELEEVSGIKGLTFCHIGRFIVSCETKEVVYKVLDYLCKEEV